MNKKTQKIIFIILICVGILFIALAIYIAFLWKDIPNIFSSNEETEEVDEDFYVRKNGDLDDIAKYSTPTDDQINTTLKQEYVNNITNLLVNKDIEQIFSLTDSIFLQKYNLNKENFERYLYDNDLIGDKVSIKGLSTGAQEDDVCIYRIKYIVDYNIKYVNLIETSAYKYTLDFEQELIPTIVEHKYNVNVQNINFVVEETKRREASITYNVTITNNNEYDVKFNLNSISGMALVMEDGNTVKQTDTALTSQSGKLGEKASISKSLFFPVNMQYQNSIIGMIFYNVEVNGNKTNLKVNF